MMKKALFFLFTIIAIAGISYAALKERGWQYNQQERIGIHEKDYPSLESIDRALNILKQSEYAAIVYPERTMRHGDSWFARNIVSPEHWESTTTAKVIYSVKGKNNSSIEYGSLSSGLPNHAVFVGLCINSETGALYTPDNGFEFPATEELVEHFKNPGIALPANDSTSCP